MAKCCGCGPGWATPGDAFRSGIREKLAYVAAASCGHRSADCLATVDVDPSSPTYCQIIHLCPTAVGAEMHHMNWNACSGNYGDKTKRRKYMICLGLNSSSVFVIDTATDPRAPRLWKTHEGKELAEKYDVSNPHSVHCAPEHVMVHFAGAGDDETGKCSFLLLDHETLDPVGLWEKGAPVVGGYDFWYQPRANVLVSSALMSSGLSSFKDAFKLEDVPKYMHQIHVWDWTTHEVKQTIVMENETPFMETRFLHNPDATEGYVAAAMSSSVYHFYRKEDGTWASHAVIKYQVKRSEGFLFDLPGFLGDIVLSLDDRWLYVSYWFFGEIRQFDISDTFNPKLTDIIQTGGLCQKGSYVKLLDEENYDAPLVKGKRVRGGPLMMQLSLDGKRLYFTCSLFNGWDKQFYPGLIETGSQMLMVDVDTENGGMKLNPDFLVDFGETPHGPFLGHTIRFPEGDSTSDIFP